MDMIYTLIAGVIGFIATALFFVWRLYTVEKQLTMLATNFDRFVIFVQKEFNTVQINTVAIQDICVVTNARVDTNEERINRLNARSNGEEF